MIATAKGRAAILGDRQAKPAPMVIDAASIPPELLQLDRWLCWIWEWDADANGGKGKWSKPPRNVFGGPGSSTDESTWTDFSTALAAVEAGDFDGIGIALGPLDDGRVLTGVDADDCRNVATGELSVDAEAVLSLLDSYAEVSPTGTGVKVLCFGALPHGRRSRGHYECYSSGRYFTVTGNRLASSRDHVRSAEPELAKFHATFIEPPKVEKATRVPTGEVDTALTVEALNALDPARTDSYEDWLLVGMALHSADPSLLDEWDRWSAQSSKYSVGQCHDKWLSFNGSGVGVGSLFHWAKQDGWKPPRRQSGGDKCTDAANAMRFAAEHGEQLRYIYAWNKWPVWTGQRWQLDDNGEVMRRAKLTADAIYHEAAATTDSNLQKAIGAWAKTSHSRQRLEAMIALAQSEHPIPVSHESLDADPWLLNCTNGTVDLRTGELRPHAPGDCSRSQPASNTPTSPASMRFSGVSFSMRYLTATLN
ncbi:MAG: PriCT-2 domain-containing protein [Pirellulales bacterium]|nr:PriCT-2 domain-containing protein [Pirellulales bacterium]